MKAGRGRASTAGEAIQEEEALYEYERSSSLDAHPHTHHHSGQHQGNPMGIGQQWSNSADGMDPAVAKQLAMAVEDKLKLAPILAKRLERVSHTSGSFSARGQQGATIVNAPVNPSGRNTPQRRVSGTYADYSNKVQVKDQSGSPTQSRGNNSHSFDEAKRQVDRDLRLFLEDVRELYDQISQREGADVPIVLEVIASIMDIAEECLETPIEDFKLTITDIVDNIEQQHLFATEPRNRRRHSQVFGPGFTNKTQKELGLHIPPAPLPTDTGGSTPKEEEEPVFRSHTMPVKAMYNMVQQLKKERPGIGPGAPGPWSEAPELSRIGSEAPDSPAADTSRSDFAVLRHQSQSSDLEGVGLASEASMGGAAKKKKSLFGKISKGFKNIADGFKRKSTSVKEAAKDVPEGLSRPHSEMLNASQHVRFRVSSDQPAQPPPSPGGSRQGTKSGLPEPADEPSGPRKLDPQRSVRFQEAPVTIIGGSDDGSPQTSGRLSGRGNGGSVGGGSSTDGDTGKRAKLMVQTDMGRPPVEDGRASASPQQSHELQAMGPPGRPKTFRRASVDLYALGMCPPGEPMSPDGNAQHEDLSVICSICEESWLSTHLEEHSIHCAVLRTLSGNGLSVDAQLTTIANVLEEWLETPLAFPALGPAPSHYHVKNQLIKLIRAARNAAALQPDGSKVPTTRCFSIQGELAEMLESAAHAHKLAVVTQTYAHRVMRLISEKVNLLAEPFGGTRVRGNSGSDAGDSGTSTPRSMPGMSIEEFEILKPISRGAFGRVYLARKLATGDLFAIKVMKKRDLIRKNMVESVTNERNILAMAQNPFVVRFYYSFTSRENLYIVMEYINGGDCYSLLRKFGALDEEVARQYVAETVLALEYCHAQGIIHRDLKPDNLLINGQGHVKLTDFGLSCVGVIDRTDNLNGVPDNMETDVQEAETEAGWGGVDGNSEYAGGAEPMETSGPKPDEGPTSSASADGGGPSGSGQGGGQSHSGRLSVPGQPLSAAASSLGLPPRPLAQHQRIVAPEHESRRAVGTPDYLAPELLLGTGHGPEVDWWALGAILYEFITGTPPFNAEAPEEIFDNILDRRITWPDEDDMSSECRDLVDKLLHPNPLKRLGHRGAGEVKLHPWFEGLDWTGLVRNKAAFIPAVEDETDTSYFEQKHVSQRSMMEDLEKLRSTGAVPPGPSSGPAKLGTSSAQEPGSGPPSGMVGGRTQVDRLKDQHHREGSGLRSGGSSNSHGSHMSRTSYTGNAAAGGPDSMDANVTRYGSLPNNAPVANMGGPDSGNMSGPQYGRASAGHMNIASGTVAQHPRHSAASSTCGGPVSALRNSGSGARNSGSGARNSGSGARNSGSGARNSGSGARASGSGVLSDRHSPGSVGTGGTMSGVVGPGGDGDGEGGLQSGGLRVGLDAYGTDGEECDRGVLDEGDEGLEEGEEEEGEGEEGEEEGHEGQEEEEEERSRSSSGDDRGEALELNTEHDPFNNFSFTNFTGLSAANMEKIQKLREHFNRRPSYTGPGT
ncbi:putative serine/threonine-protein kinase [Tetrabaena socialis]|uniref:non-specific serine/threonine protein kinase n=1 Tax=Tetrabaena socialis TaxID=47790 RepID=A0A2J7ZZE8_9CHLO|nr:putative serine/threonine-protein kinase [Tetrabaena socialis]|eukprot:PNH05649.1 putative serine/threonine-protein kinase [Tetrabaena socialis]